MFLLCTPCGRRSPIYIKALIYRVLAPKVVCSFLIVVSALFSSFWITKSGLTRDQRGTRMPALVHRLLLAIPSLLTLQALLALLLSADDSHQFVRPQRSTTNNLFCVVQFACLLPVFQQADFLTQNLCYWCNSTFLNVDAINQTNEPILKLEAIIDCPCLIGCPHFQFFSCGWIN